jgi:hypothetical protein
MDGLSKLSREAQVVLGGGVMLLILSFLHWQAYLGFGVNEWHGIGVLAGLLVIAMLAWEVVRLTAGNVPLGTLSPGLVSVGLALLMALFTVIAFLNKDLLRQWPAWIALIVALGVAVAAVMRARAEGVEMPQGKPAGSAEPAGYVEPAGSAEPAESAAPAGSADPNDATDDAAE